MYSQYNNPCTRAVYSCTNLHTFPNVLPNLLPTVMEMTSTTQPPTGHNDDIIVYIIEDYKPYRELVQELINLEEDMHCPYVFESCEDYIGVFHKIPPPTVLLMDIKLKEKMDGIEGTRRIKELNPDIKVVMLTNYDSNNDILNSRGSGAVGYIIKDDEPEVLTAKIREAAKGGVAMSSTATIKIQSILENKFKPVKKKEYGLTPREKEVTRYLVKESKTRREIAEILIVAYPTVDAHVQNIYRKLEVNSNTQLVKKVYEERLLDNE